MNELTNVESLVPQASAFVYTLLKEKLPPQIVYHTYQHAVDVVDAVEKIGRKSGLPRNEFNLVLLAAWFHDVGFVETYEGHEEVGVRIATGFLESNEVSDEAISRVAAYIRATRKDHQPTNPGEQVIRDADIAHVGSKTFFKRSKLLRAEWEARRGHAYSDQEWAETQLEFLINMRFYTDYAREKYEPQRQKNLHRIQERLAEELLDTSKNGQAQSDKKKDATGRGIETMFRSTYRNHINLSAMADRKANIMISINAILMSILISFVSTRIRTNPWLVLPAAALLVTCLVAIVFAILSARPKVTSTAFSLEDVRTRRGNILFFGNFVKMPVDEFKVGMHDLMGDWDMLYDNMIRDIYSLGQVLSTKYRLLWLSYTAFMAGISISVILFLLTFLFY